MGNTETPQETLIRGVYKETCLKIESATLLSTFNQIPNSGYFNPFCPNLLFIDFRTIVSNKDVHLDEQAQDFVWIPPKKALNELNLEPNARLTLETYLKTESSNL